MKKILASVALLTMITQANSAMAQTEQQVAKTPNDPTSVITAYLTAATKGDTEQMASLSIDTRIKANEAQNEYKHMLKKSREQLRFFKINSVEETSDTTYIVRSTMSFKDGHVSLVPFNVTKKDGNWKVTVTPESLESGVVELQQAPESPTTNSLGSYEPEAAMLTNWDYSGLQGTLYSIGVFDVNNSAKLVTINLQQTIPYNPYQTQASMEYAVVQKHWYGDTVYGQTVVTGNYWGTGAAVKRQITGTVTTFTEAQMRFVYQTASKGAVSGFGEVYNGY